MLCFDAVSVIEHKGPMMNVTMTVTLAGTSLSTSEVLNHLGDHFLF
jgi:hypothetical protein